MRPSFLLFPVITTKSQQKVVIHENIFNSHLFLNSHRILPELNITHFKQVLQWFGMLWLPQQLTCHLNRSLKWGHQGGPGS